MRVIVIDPFSHSISEDFIEVLDTHNLTPQTWGQGSILWHHPAARGDFCWYTALVPAEVGDAPKRHCAEGIGYLQSNLLDEEFVRAMIEWRT